MNVPTVTHFLVTSSIIWTARRPGGGSSTGKNLTAAPAPARQSHTLTVSLKLGESEAPLRRLHFVSREQAGVGHE